MVNDQIEKDIKIILDYLWRDEKRNYQEWGGYPKHHIFRIVKRLAKSIKYKPSNCFNTNKSEGQSTTDLT